MGLGMRLPTVSTVAKNFKATIVSLSERIVYKLVAASLIVPVTLAHTIVQCSLQCQTQSVAKLPLIAIDLDQPGFPKSPY